MTISNTEENEEGSTTENIQKHQLTEMNLHFKLPVQYTDSKELHIDTINDLELVGLRDRLPYYGLESKQAGYYIALTPGELKNFSAEFTL